MPRKGKKAGAAKRRGVSRKNGDGPYVPPGSVSAGGGGGGSGAHDALHGGVAGMQVDGPSQVLGSGNVLSIPRSRWSA